MVLWRKYIWVCWVLSILPLEGIQAQNVGYIQYTTRDGLPTNYVYGVVEDNDGYIWAYTENGLAKFDGYTFQHYSMKDGLPGNDIPRCLKDKEGRIWIWAINRELSYLYRDSIHMVYKQPCHFVNGLLDGEINGACSNGKGFVFSKGQLELYPWFQLDSFVLKAEEGWKWDSRDLELSEEDHLLTLSPPWPGLYGRTFPDGYLIYSALSGTIYWRRGKIRRAFQLGIDPIPEVHRQELLFFQLGKEDSFLMRESVGGIRRMFIIDIEKESCLPVPVDSTGISQAVNFQVYLFDSTFVVSAEYGFIEFDLEGNRIEKYDFSHLQERYYLLNFFKDSKNNLWVGSREGGLFMVPAGYRSTGALPGIDEKDKAFECLIPDESGRLLGITDNAGIYEIKADGIRSIYPPDKYMRFRSATTTPSGPLLVFSGGHVLISRQDNERRFVHFTESDLKGSRAFQDEERTLQYLANSSTLAYHEKERVLYTGNPHSRKFLARFSFPTGREIQLESIFYPSADVLFYHAERKELLLGNKQGVYSFSRDTSLLTVSVNEVSALYGQGPYLWIGTRNDGLFRYHFEKKKLSRVLNAPMIRKIRKDSDSTLLAATNKGVFILPVEGQDSSSIRNFGLVDGLPSNEILDVYSEGGSRIFVASSEGVHLIKRELKNTPVLEEKDLSLTRILINKREVSDLSSLKYFENNLIFEYHLQSMESNGKVDYFTRLLPVEKEWQQSGERKVNYLALSPGNYEFQLKARDVYGNEASLQPISIHIRKALWQRNWLRGLVLALGVSALLAFFLRRDRQRKKSLEGEKRLSQRMARLELSALRAQMNPHFVFNALGAIQYFIQTHDVESADKYLTRFGRLMREYLNYSRERMIPLNKEVELLEIYTDLERLRFEGLFTIDIEVDDELVMNEVFLPSMLIQPFVENAINHGLGERRDGMGKLEIHFYPKGDLLICEIRDNGIGRREAEKRKRKGHQSKGMQIIRERVETINSSNLAKVEIQIEDLDKEVEMFPGTRVILQMNLFEDE
jgi:ligand-binding sensor domain-containing protein